MQFGGDAPFAKTQKPSWNPSDNNEYVQAPPTSGDTTPCRMTGVALRTGLCPQTTPAPATLASRIRKLRFRSRVCSGGFDSVAFDSDCEDNYLRALF